MKMESLQQRREELVRKEYQLKESLLKFDKFLKVECSNYSRSAHWHGFEMIDISSQQSTCMYH